MIAPSLYHRRFKSVDPHSPLNGEWTPALDFEALLSSLQTGWEYEDPTTGKFLPVTPNLLTTLTAEWGAFVLWKDQDRLLIQHNCTGSEWLLE